MRPRAALLSTLLLLAALAAFGARVHWVEEAGTAERDGFVAQAEQILAGGAPHDAFRPPLYPYAVAALARATGDPFVAARLLANLSAAALALLAWAFARRLAPAAHADLAGGFGFALVAANPNTWILGQHVTTDMPFAALAGAALLAALSYLERPRLASAAAAGLAYGAAAATRGNALLLLPGLAAAWGLGGRRRAASGTTAPAPATHGAWLGHLALAAALAAAALLPHWWLRAREFGSAFYDENWKNLVWKLHGYPDWSKLAAIGPDGGFGQVLRNEPGAVARGALAELWRFASSGAAQLLGTGLHVVATAVGAWRLLAARAATAPGAPGVQHPRRAAAGWLLAAAAVFVGGIATAFFTWGRFLLLLLPVAAALLAAGALTPGTRLTRALGWLALAPLVALLAMKTAFFRLPAFIERHPYDDVATLRGLELELPHGATLAGTSPFLERYLAHPYVAIPDATAAEIADPARFEGHLVELLRARRVAFLVVGAVDLRDRPPALLDASTTPSGLALVSRTPRVTVWRVIPPGGNAAPTAGTAAQTPP